MFGTAGDDFTRARVYVQIRGSRRRLLVLFQHVQDSTGHRLSMIHGGISTHLHAVHGTPDSPGRQDIRAAVSLLTRLPLRVKVRVGPSPRLAWPFHHLNQVDAINSMSPPLRFLAIALAKLTTKLHHCRSPQLPSPLPFHSFLSNGLNTGSIRAASPPQGATQCRRCSSDSQQSFTGASITCWRQQVVFLNPSVWGQRSAAME